MKNPKLNILTIITIVIFILTSYFVFYCEQNPNTYVTKLPVIIMMFIVTMIIIPITIIKLLKGKNEKRELIIRIVSKLLIFMTSTFLLVLLFTTKGLTLEVGSVFSILNSLFLILLFVKSSKFKVKDVLYEHFTITSIFIGLLMFLR